MSTNTVVDDVRRTLLAHIGTGRLRPGERLGAERDLAVDLGVSRSSLRQALTLLEQAGAVRRVPGRGGGTFVSTPKIERDLSTVVGVPALLRAQGFTAGTRVVSTGLIAADDATQHALGVAATDLVFDVVRIRLADGVPISLEHVRLPAARFAGLLDHPLGGSMYELLEHSYGVTPSTAVESIEVVAASEHEAAVLEIEPAAALLSINRTARDEHGAPFEFSHDLFRADRTRIVVSSPGAASARCERRALVELTSA